MELTTYQLMMLALAIMIQTAGVTGYIAKIKNDLTIRVAVLEASHDTLAEDLKEIKEDVKDVLRAIAHGTFKKP